jgi:hypothetical protein
VQVCAADAATVYMNYCFSLRDNWFGYIDNGKCSMTCNETSFHGLELDALCVSTIDSYVAACYQAGSRRCKESYDVCNFLWFTETLDWHFCDNGIVEIFHVLFDGVPVAAIEIDGTR